MTVLLEFLDLPAILVIPVQTVALAVPENVEHQVCPVRMAKLDRKANVEVRDQWVPEVRLEFVVSQARQVLKAHWVPKVLRVFPGHKAPRDHQVQWDLPVISVMLGLTDQSVMKANKDHEVPWVNVDPKVIPEWSVHRACPAIQV